MRRQTNTIGIDKLKYYLIILGMINVLTITYSLGTYGAGYFMLTLFLVGSVLALVSIWISDFIAKYVKGRAARKQYINAKHFYKGALISVGIPAFVLTVLILVFGNMIGKFLFKDTFIGVCIIVAAPIIFLWTISEIISGYYRGMGMVKTAKIFMLVRQVSIFFFSLVAMERFMKYGEKIASLLHNQGLTSVYGAIGSLAGIGFGCFLGLLVLFVFWILLHGEFNRLYDQDTTKYPESVLDCSKIILVSGMFGGIKLFFLSAPLLVDFVLYIHICMKNVSSPEYMKIAGNYFGIILPVFVIIIYVFLLWNNRNFKGLGGLFRNEDYMQIRERRMGILLNLLVYVLPISAAMAVLAQPLCKILRCDVNEDTTRLFMLSAMTVFTFVFSSMEQRWYSVLNEVLLPFIAISAGFVVQTILAFTCFKIDRAMLGITIPYIIEHVIIALILFLFVIRKIRLSSVFFKKMIMIIIVALASVLTMLLIYQIGCSKLLPEVAILICVIPGVIIYVVALTALRLISSPEAERMPGGLLFLIVNRFIRQE